MRHSIFECLFLCIPNKVYLYKKQEAMTIDDLLAAAEVIKSETGISKNTHIRVGAILENMINFFANNIAPVTSDLIKDAISKSTSGIRKGMTVEWDLDLGPIPTGFVLANGNGGVKINGVTIRDRRGSFAIGYDPAKFSIPFDDAIEGKGIENYGKVGNVGGSNKHTLTQDELPPTFFYIFANSNDPGNNTLDSNPLAPPVWSTNHLKGNQDYDIYAKPGAKASIGVTNTIGKGIAFDMRPRYITVCYITKVSDDIDGGGSGSGIESIVEGTNVEIDKTDPKNPIINVPITNGDDGRGIVSIERTAGNGAAGTTDTYTITYTDAITSTFTVYNGANGTGGGSSVIEASNLDNLTWNVETDGAKKTLTITEDTNIDIIIKNGEEASILVDGNGFNLSIAGKIIATSSTKKTLIAILNYSGKLVTLHQFVSTYTFIEGVSDIVFIGSNLINTNSIWSGVNSGYGNLGISSGYIVAGVSNRVYFQFKSGDTDAAFGFTTGSIGVGYSGMSVGLFIHASIIYMCGGVYGSYRNTLYSAKTGYFYALTKDNSGNIILQESFDEITWDNILIYPVIYNNSFSICCDINGDGGKLSTPKIAASISIPEQTNILNFAGANITNNNGIFRGINAGFGNLGIAPSHQLSASGRIYIKHTVKAVYGVLGFTTGSIGVGYTQMFAGIYFYNTGANDNIMACGLNVSGGYLLIEAVTVGYYYAIYRDVTGNLHLQKSADAITWSTIYTYSQTSLSILTPCCDIADASSYEGILVYPKYNY